VHRRNFLKTAAFTAAAAGLTACSRRVHSAVPEMFSPEFRACTLPKVYVSPDREIRTVVGLRPYRPSGFVVRAERLGDKLIVHNYGHGGGGITLSWGTSKLAVDLGAQGHTGPVAVLGCGVVGLSTARLLQDSGFTVTIYAKDVPPNTTSNIAGGQWFPVYVSERDKTTDEFNRQFTAATEFAYKRYQSLVGTRYGVRWMRNYMPHNDDWPETGSRGKQGPFAPFLPELRDLQPQENPFSGFRFVRQFDGMIIEPAIYLRALLQDFHEAGGTIRVGELRDRAAIAALPEALVFNCTGLGARALFGDEELIPLKGQLTVLLPQPEVNYALLAGELYMFSRSDGILLGGTHERNVWTLNPDLEAKARIIAGHKALFDAFRGCEHA
jgi:glycine/D-amino acid oxidase-like deaminating enzyme